jgi:hypothetical protein
MVCLASHGKFGNDPTRVTTQSDRRLLGLEGQGMRKFLYRVLIGIILVPLGFFLVLWAEFWPIAATSRRHFQAQVNDDPWQV